jgi:hypothetical protein
MSAAGGSPPPTGPGSSVSLDGSGEYFAVDPKAANGMGGTFSLSFWFKAATLPASDRRIFSLAKDSGVVADGANMIHLSCNAGELKFRGRTNLASLVKDWRWTGFATGTWYHFAMTRTGGGTVTTYIDGAVRAPDSTPTDLPWAIANSDRVLYYGQSAALTSGEFWDGNLGHLALWGNRVLSGAAIGDIFAGKHSIDLTAASGSYSATDAANLDHYYRPGYADVGTTDEGVDFGGLNLDDTVGLDSSDIVADAP